MFPIVMLFRSSLTRSSSINKKEIICKTTELDGPKVSCHFRPPLDLQCSRNTTVTIQCHSRPFNLELRE